MGILLGYKSPRGVYQRQQGPNAIPVVRIGGTIRVYADAVVDTLENGPERAEIDAPTLLSLYRAGLKHQKRAQTSGD